MRNPLTGRSSGSYRKDISSAVITASPSSFTYTGNPCTPAIMLQLDGTVLKPNDDYSVRYVGNVSVGTALAYVEGKGSFVGSSSVGFKIDAVPVADTDLSNASVTLQGSSFTYTGSQITPTVTVKMGGSALAQGVDYNVSYSDNTAVGAATVTVSAVDGGTYRGSKSVTFSIVKPDLSNATVTLNAYVFSYTGTLVCPVVTVTMTVGTSTLTLVKGTDYDVSYSDNGKRGIAYATVTGTGGYSGKKSVEFQIGKDISLAAVDIFRTTYPYTGYQVDPEPTVTLAGSKLVKNVDYTVSYSDNVNIGLGRVTVTGMGDYIGSVSSPLNIDNSESEAWENIELDSSMRTATNEATVPYGIFPQSSPHVFGKAKDLGGGVFATVVFQDLYPNTHSTVTDYANNARMAVYRFEPGHEYDLTPGQDGYPLYLGGTPMTVTSARAWSGSNTNLDFKLRPQALAQSFDVADYGRKMVVPCARYMRVKDSAGSYPLGGVSWYPVSDETSGNGSVVLDSYYKYITGCDLYTPYDLTDSSYGSERRMYKIPSSFNITYRGYITNGQFSADGKRFFYIYESDYASNSPKVVTLVLRDRFTLTGSESVESVTETPIRTATMWPANASSIFRIRGMSFSPNGKAVVYMMISESLSWVRLVRLSEAWNVASGNHVSEISGNLLSPNGSDRLFNNSSAGQNFFLFCPKYGKMLVSGYSFSSRVYNKIYEFTIA